MRFGNPDVEVLLSEISAPQMWHWFALNSLDPWTESRGDAQAAIVAAAVTNVHSKSRIPVSRFMPDWDSPSQETDPKAMQALLEKAFPK